MNSIKLGYYYIFYRLYKMSEAAPSKWLSDWKASMALGLLEMWFLISILIYYRVFTNSSLDILGNNIFWFLMVIMLTLIDYFAFHNKNQWKNIVVDFDKLSPKKNRIYGIIAWSFILLIIINTIFSYYCLDLKARRDQIGPYAPSVVAKKKFEDSLQKAQQIENLKKIYGEDKK
ncbi:hypothetical protein JET18_05115 [Chryseobacterium sp. L7]|uniref:Uncharacterized protein n=1 Tax=Chryseobacterium endalhagicum TaxID=2797638 RepID=A0ABS1QC59_9FLAO|nr:hypothetical protein [Chryseobacterium endalhagicum]MBL1220206.1 hypothetical protein [Chryseobacterium endalhagicum]